MSKSEQLNYNQVTAVSEVLSQEEKFQQINFEQLNIADLIQTTEKAYHSPTLLAREIMSYLERIIQIMKD